MCVYTYIYIYTYIHIYTQTHLVSTIAGGMKVNNSIRLSLTYKRHVTATLHLRPRLVVSNLNASLSKQRITIQNTPEAAPGLGTVGRFTVLGCKVAVEKFERRFVVATSFGTEKTYPGR
jgi:hypothetical protein